MFSLFKVNKSHQKAMSKVWIIVSCSKYYKNDFCYQAKAPSRDALANDNLALSLTLFNLLE